MAFARTLLLECTKYRNHCAGFLTVGRYQLMWRHLSFHEVDDPYPLTKQEAISYLESTLKIGNWESLLAENPLSFLKVVSSQTKSRVAYTNLPYFVKDGLKNPTLFDCKELMMDGLGGNCFVFNPFLQAVFAHLGLQTKCVPAKVFHWGNADFFGHVGIIFENLTCNGDLHIMDPGNPHPNIGAVSLNIDNSSATYDSHAFHYKYFMVNQGVVQLCQKVNLSHLTEPGNRCQFIYQDDEYWKVLYTYNILVSKSPSYFVGANQILCDDTQIFPMIHRELLLIGYQNGRMLNIKRHSCITIDENGEKTVTKFKGTPQLIETIQRYFPQYSNEKLEYPFKYLDIQK